MCSVACSAAVRFSVVLPAYVGSGLLALGGWKYLICPLDGGVILAISAPVRVGARALAVAADVRLLLVRQATANIPTHTHTNRHTDKREWVGGWWWAVG